ncbi:MAG: AAA family ATPase [Nitrospinaceae bacterium]|nr:AAA family ATPase [Nitrospinaceae bacterium]NIR54305.1 AAA family ATPase [Nitrospinaceae bacterium]NIS84723.1 AAA family ATPase [Nitrospinaceae bacterium]NIT81524.1 AAA family ATPase [Nitrospinaceae bacterium]NIU43809.1 AAA family ATPase [Nitrospinaceae bacterium]
MPTTKKTDYYKALGVSPSATPREIKESYLGWIRYFDHPEECPKPGDLQGTLSEQIEQIQQAYDLLSDEVRREKYNGTLPRTPEPGPEEPAPRLYQEMENMIASRKKARDYLEFFSLRERPFESTPDPHFLYLSARHKEVLAQLILGLQENKGIQKIAGEGGTGKTTLCRRFLKELHTGFDLAYLYHPCADALELLQSVNAALGLPAQSKIKNELLQHLHRHLQELKAGGRRLAVVVDEAQQLSMEALEELRVLSNIETEKEKLLQVILMGQPVLDKILSRSKLAPLRQRISAHWELYPLNIEETHGYIQHRLDTAGGKGKLAFGRPAAEAVFRMTGGIPRGINRLADCALCIAHNRQVKKIDPEIIRAAVKELGLTKPKSKSLGWIWKLAGMATLLAAAIVAAFIFRSELGWAPEDPQAVNLNRVIQKAPLDPASPGRLVPQRLPQTRTLSSVGNPAKNPASAAELILKDDKLPEAKPVTDPAELAEILTGLSAGESKIEAAKWVLLRWGALRKDTVTLQPGARDILKRDFGLSVYETHGNLDRLTTLNYPALVEIRLPGKRAKRYLSLVRINGENGVFQTDQLVEMPLALFESVWTHKAWIVWKNFEQLPGNMRAGFEGPESQWLQQQLSVLGFYKQKPILRYGDRTADAVAKFQRYYNIKDHGRFDTETQMILYNRLPAYPVPRLTGG